MPDNGNVDKTSSRPMSSRDQPIFLQPGTPPRSQPSNMPLFRRSALTLEEVIPIWFLDFYYSLSVSLNVLNPESDVTISNSSNCTHSSHYAAPIAHGMRHGELVEIGEMLGT